MSGLILIVLMIHSVVLAGFIILLAWLLQVGTVDVAIVTMVAYALSGIFSGVLEQMRE